MEAGFLLCFCMVTALLLGIDAAGLSDDGVRHLPKSLFVFGDSTVDTGNTGKNSSRAWRTPYGITFPGKPSGRNSDGRVLTDFVGNFFFSFPFCRR
ncbi:unnamed protein product [Victoria cruziana]